MSKKCDHVVAFRFGHEESDFTGEVILKSELKYPKSNYRHRSLRTDENDENADFVCNHCPNCGEKLIKALNEGDGND